IAQARRARQQAKDERGFDFDYAQAERDPRFRESRRGLLEEFPEIERETPLEDLEHKQLYANPYAEYLQGLFFLYSGFPGDREVGRTAIRNAAGMRRNTYLLSDVAFAETAAARGSTPPRVFVIFESGMAPKKVEYRLDVPVVLYNLAIHDTKVDYFGIAIPALRKVGFDHPCLLVTADGKTMETEILADMDAIIAREYKNELPLIITRAVIRSVSKMVVQYATAKALEDEDPYVQLLGRAAVAIYSAATNQADTRTWRTLPKNVQLASFPPPSDGQVLLEFPDGRMITSVSVDPNRATLIWVRCPSISAPAIVKQLYLN
ncbi:MAG: hypothetical protein NZ561_00750, partial [Phycisphaerae bacterium]|nr:hypothetical protein [Phycisphaerae bacterium]MDW8263082.1 hypothetical protein [Phycisphaerales bacterium]